MEIDAARTVLSPIDGDKLRRTVYAPHDGDTVSVVLPWLALGEILNVFASGASISGTQLRYLTWRQQLHLILRERSKQ